MRAYSLTPLGTWIRVTGEDALMFLQGQFSNDLKDGLKNFINTWYTYGLWLDHKGKILADSTILKGKTTGEFWIHSTEGRAQDLIARLERFIIADDVILEDKTDEYMSFTLIGKDLYNILNDNILSNSYSFKGRRSIEDSFEIIALKEQSHFILEVIKVCSQLSANDLEKLRIEAGFASVPRDVGANDLPHELGLNSEGLSVTKGCYVGQEVMARVTSRGKLRRKLVRVVGSGDLPHLPVAIWDNGIQVGEMRSAVKNGDGFIGLAVIAKGPLEKTSQFSLTQSGAPTVHLRP
jgi:tRNA-modifying protein YgfZ